MRLLPAHARYPNPKSKQPAILRNATCLWGPTLPTFHQFWGHKTCISLSLLSRRLGLSSLGFQEPAHHEEIGAARFVHLTAVCSWLLLQMPLHCCLPLSPGVEMQLEASYRPAILQPEQHTTEVTNFSHSYIKEEHKKNHHIKSML